MKPLTFSIALLSALLAPPSVAIGAMTCPAKGLCEFLVTPDDNTFRLDVANPTALQMPGQITGCLHTAMDHEWIVEVEGDTVLVRPGEDPVSALLVVEAGAVKVNFTMEYEGAAGVRFGIVSETPIISDRVDRDEVERERWRDAGEVMAADVLLAPVESSKGALRVDVVTGRWVRGDFFASLHYTNTALKPVEPQEWRASMSGRVWRDPVVIGGEIVGPGRRGRAIVVLRGAAPLAPGPLRLLGFMGGSEVARTQTGDWRATDEEKRVAESIFAEHDRRLLDLDAENRVHLAAYGLVAAVMLDGMDGAEMGKGVGIRWAKGVNRHWSWEMDGAVIECEDATLGRFFMGGRGQIGQTGWVPVAHAGFGFYGGRAMGQLRVTGAITGRLSVERELFSGLMLSTGAQVVISASMGESVEAGAQIGARWK